jgi:hypothetical protein
MLSPWILLSGVLLALEASLYDLFYIGSQVLLVLFHEELD